MIAPSDMQEGYTFDVTVNGVTFVAVAVSLTRFFKTVFYMTRRKLNFVWINFDERSLLVE